MEMNYLRSYPQTALNGRTCHATPFAQKGANVCRGIRTQMKAIVQERRIDIRVLSRLHSIGENVIVSVFGRRKKQWQKTKNYTDTKRKIS